MQIISADIVDTILLGNSDFETSRNSYNNMMKTLYDKAQNYLNLQYACAARCVGSDPSDPDWDTEIDEADYYSKSEGESEYYEYMIEYYGTFKNVDIKLDTDWTQMEKIQDISGASSYYCLASRALSSTDYSSGFGVRHVSPTGTLGFGFFTTVKKNETTSHETELGFRPVFTLNSTIKITKGDGINIPYTLAQ